MRLVVPIVMSLACACAAEGNDETQGQSAETLTSGTENTGTSDMTAGGTATTGTAGTTASDASTSAETSEATSISSSDSATTATNEAGSGSEDDDSADTSNGAETSTSNDSNGSSESGESNGTSESSESSTTLDDSTSETTSTDTTGSTDDGGGCPALPDPAPTWLSGMQMEIVSKLTGHTPIPPDDITLTDRATVERRAVARDHLVAAWTDYGLMPTLHTYDTGQNVVVELAAEDGSDEVIVVGAHYDSVSASPGANDNATGVAMVMAASRYLATVACRTVDVRFVLFDQEEIGLVGSAAYAADLANESVDVLSVHTIDQMGWDEDGDRAIELEHPDGDLYELYASVVDEIGAAIPLTETSTTSTDHDSFRDHGFIAVGLTEEYVSGDTTPHYHDPTDTYATVNFDYLQSTSVLFNAVLARISRE